MGVEATRPRTSIIFWRRRGRDQINSAGGRSAGFIEKRGSREEEAGVNHKQAPRGPWEGWDEVGGPPSPLSSLDPWGITGTNKPL